VVFFVAMFAVALAVVALTKGSFHRLGQIQFRSLWMLLAALIVQFALELVEFPKDRIEDVGFSILLLSYGLILGFCWRNRRVKGMRIVTVGIALNLLVIALNQGMPTKDDVRVVGGREVHVPFEQTVKHRPQDEDTILPFLGDVLSLPGLPNQQFSIGDVVISLGIVDVCFEASRVPRRRGQRLAAPQQVTE
jgi:chromate transport protein ChrA